MALYPLNPGVQPLGQFDVLNTQLTGVLGGEVMTFGLASRTNTSTETAAADALDGYDYADATAQRVVAQLASTNAELPLFLADDGNSPDYLTYFGQVVGSSVGLQTTGGAKLGPHSASGSGKVTLWDKPGLYGVSLDAVAADFVSTLVGAGGLAPGASIGFNGSSKLAHNSCSGAVAGSGVATFVDFEGSPSLVTTPNRLVGAADLYSRVRVWFHAGMQVRTL